MVYVKLVMYDGINEEVFNKVCKLKTVNLDRLSLIEMVKSWYFDVIEDYDMYKNSLINSIQLNQNFVYNFRDLGQFYLKIGRNFEGKQLLAKALKNVKKVYSDDDPLRDLTDIEEYFNEHLKGIHLSYVNYNAILDLYENGKNSWQMQFK